MILSVILFINYTFELIELYFKISSDRYKTFLNGHIVVMGYITPKNLWKFAWEYYIEYLSGSSFN